MAVFLKVHFFLLSALHFTMTTPEHEQREQTKPLISVPDNDTCLVMIEIITWRINIERKKVVGTTNSKVKSVEQLNNLVTRR